MDSGLHRFIIAQETDYQQALTEIRSGKKTGHWMWYIFPQLTGLGYSETSKFYALNNLNEAKEFLDHPILGSRLREITNVLLNLEHTDANQIFGSPDDLKLKSCMTLFSVVEDTDTTIFKKVIEKYFNGRLDEKTLKLMQN